MSHTHDKPFRTTMWSLVVAATSDPAALDELLRAYWEPIYAYFRRSGHSRQDAADLAQEFVAQRMINGTLLSSADPERGRFRTLLKASLRNFSVDHERHRRAMLRSPPNGVMLDAAALDDLEPHHQDDPGGAFDRQWVATLLSRTLEQVQTECAGLGQEKHWRAFEQAVVRPALGEVHPVPLADLARELGEDSSAAVSAMIQTVRRKFRRILHALVEETVAHPQDAEQELGELHAFSRF